MILPDKYEDVNYSFIVLGYRILKELLKRNYNVHKLFKKISKTYGIDILYYYDILTFLWLLDAIQIKFNIISYNSDLK